MEGAPLRAPPRCRGDPDRHGVGEVAAGAHGAMARLVWGGGSGGADCDPGAVAAGAGRVQLHRAIVRLRDEPRPRHHGGLQPSRVSRWRAEHAWRRADTSLCDGPRWWAARRSDHEPGLRPLLLPAGPPSLRPTPAGLSSAASWLARHHNT